MMSPLENLYYAIGELAYAMARADGNIQKEEKKRFLDMCVNDLGGKKDGALVAEIIFKVLSKQEVFTAEAAYEVAIQTIRQNSHYLSPELKEKAVRLLEKVAEASPPVTKDERSLLSKFKADIEPLKGDPIYYGRS